eukprot:scaffold130200_cov36-Tisochrysis_lutea.AAC.4
MSSIGPVIRWPQQQKTFLVGHTSYARTTAPGTAERALAPAAATASAAAAATSRRLGRLDTWAWERARRM